MDFCVPSAAAADQNDARLGTVIPEDVGSRMASLTLNFSAANMGAVMLALQQKCALLPPVPAQ